MTREERIEKLRHLITCMKCKVSGKSCDDNCPTQYDAGNMGEIIENLEEVVKALKQETKWIPVSERLPLLRGLYKISDDVLVTDGYEIDMGYLVERKGKTFWHYYGGEYEIGIKDEDNDAIAWMPLPKPYKPESEEV